MIGIQGIVRDITEHKRAEVEMKRLLMKFKLEDGHTYLVKDTAMTQSLEVVKDLLKVGYSGLVFSRTPTKQLTSKVNGDLRFFWLSDKNTEGSIQPDLKTIEQLIERQPRRNLFFIDRLDYLISKNSYKKVLNFVQHLSELAINSDHIFIISIDPTTLDPVELRRLEKETLDVKPSTITILPEYLLAVLKFIHNRNVLGIKPSHRDISKELGLSKPTIKKRIDILISGGYVIENKRGREKAIELTDQGSTIFS